MEILPFIKSNLSSKEIYDFVMDIKVNDLDWKADAPDLQTISEVYLSGKGNFWIAKEDNNLVGTIGLQDMGNKQGYLKRMYVKRKYRGTGLAQKLLAILIKHARENGFEEIFLATGKGAERAIAFYEKSGFQRIDSIPSNFSHFNDPYMYRLDV